MSIHSCFPLLFLVGKSKGRGPRRSGQVFLVDRWGCWWERVIFRFTFGFLVNSVRLVFGDFGKGVRFDDCIFLFFPLCFTFSGGFPAFFEREICRFDGSPFSVLLKR